MGTYFHPEAIKFLRGLIRHNDRPWFEARRGVYERELKVPMLALIEEINAAMVEFAPDHIRPPAKTMLRIYRDTRFSADKRPYKRHVSAWFGKRGAVRTTGAGFYLHISPAEVNLAMGVFMPPPEQLLLLRRGLAETHASYNALVKKITKARKGEMPLEPVDPHALARMPKGFSADHPADALLRARRWGVRVSLPVETALQPDFSRQVIRRFRLAAPLVLALDEGLTGGQTEAARKRVRAFF